MPLPKVRFSGGYTKRPRMVENSKATLVISVVGDIAGTSVSL
ncbi:MAG: hypothetical protein P8L79_02195 [Rhodospirillaceae bacterium]|nr:hypothetical protein [Rhodospirillaceae bacterium]